MRLPEAKDDLSVASGCPGKRLEARGAFGFSAGLGSKSSLLTPNPASCFYTVGVLSVGVLIITAFLFWGLYSGPLFWRLPTLLCPKTFTLDASSVSLSAAVTAGRGWTYALLTPYIS